MLNNLIRKLEKFSTFQFLLLFIVLSEILSAIMNSLFSKLLWGKISLDLIAIGSADALVVSLVVSSIGIYLLRKNAKLITINEKLLLDERKACEQAEESEKALQLSRFTVDKAGDAVYWMDSEARIIDVNETACRMLGYRREELLNLTVFGIDPDFTAAQWAKSWESVKGNGTLTIETRHHTRDGRIIPVEIMANYLIFRGKELNCAFARDISERRLLEEERIKTQKLESIGVLAGGIAHDFNNLLQGIFGYISMAKVSLDRPDRTKIMLQQAEEALNLSVNLTSQLLTFSKGGKPFKKLILLKPMIERAVKFALSGSRTDYLLEISSDLWPVEADEGQLAQVIQNIVLNAKEAMAGRGTVIVSARNADIPREKIPGLPEGGWAVCISMQDSGTGITEQNLAKIFDPYFTTKQKGNGLGLATSYSIIRNHGGIIEVRSRVTKGSTFTLYLPAAKDASMTCESTGVITSAGRKGKILVMDDEELIRNVAKDMIESLGHEVLCAEDGKSAIELFSRARMAGSPFDMLILDLTVKGGMGGEDAIKKLREIDPDIVAVVSSGYADNQVVADYRMHGFSGVLNKPYKMDVLKDCVNVLIKEP